MTTIMLMAGNYAFSIKYQTRPDSPHSSAIKGQTRLKFATDDWELDRGYDHDSTGLGGSKKENTLRFTNSIGLLVDNFHEDVLRLDLKMMDQRRRPGVTVSIVS